MTEKVLYEFQIVQTEGGIKYRYKRGKRTYVSHAPKDITNGMYQCSKTSQTKQRDLRQALNTLEKLYDELYPPETSV